MSLPSTSSFLFQEDTEHTALEVILQGSQLLRIDNEESYSQVGKTHISHKAQVVKDGNIDTLESNYLDSLFSIKLLREER